jgi:hypothetical protein
MSGHFARPATSYEGHGMTRKPPLILMLAISVVYGVALPFLPHVGEAARVVDLAAGLPLLICAAWWCQLDSRLKDISFPRWLIWLIVLTSPIGLCVHFFRSRRPGEAILAILVAAGDAQTAAVLFVVVMLAATVAGAVLSAWTVCSDGSLVRYCPLEAV